MGFTDKGYRCVCRDGFEGKDCTGMTTFINFPFFTTVLIFSLLSSSPPASIIVVVVVHVIVIVVCISVAVATQSTSRRNVFAYSILIILVLAFIESVKYNAGIMGIQNDENNKKMMMIIKLPICLIVNHCSGSPCANGGSCSNLADGYKCSCIEGRFTGKLCEQGETTTYLV